MEGRDLPEERVREIADGRIYSGEQARDLGLVDSFGGLDEAAKISQELANVQGATVVRYVQPETFTDALLARLAPREPEALRIAEEAGLDLDPKPYYLYLPGAEGRERFPLRSSSSTRDRDHTRQQNLKAARPPRGLAVREARRLVQITAARNTGMKKGPGAPDYDVGPLAQSSRRSSP